MAAGLPTKEDQEVAQSLLDYINASDTPFHAVEQAAARLRAEGFQQLSARAAWEVAPGGRYFFTRNGSTLVAFAVGARYQPGAGIYMVGAHTDR